MTNTDISQRNGRGGVTQARGVLRRELLISVAEQFLCERPLDEISLADVALKAGIPVGSAYHFFPKINDLFFAVASNWNEQLVDCLMQPNSQAEAANWDSLIGALIQRISSLYNANPFARELILGAKTPPDVKRADRRNDEQLGHLIASILDEHFVLHDFPNRLSVLFYGIEIADLFFTLSNIRHGKITDEACLEAQRAVIAYLRTYLPGYLMPRNRLTATVNSPLADQPLELS